MALNSKFVPNNITRFRILDLKYCWRTLLPERKKTMDNKSKASTKQNNVKSIKRFAYLGEGQVFYEELARKARSEPWGYADNGNRPFLILERYIKYTFARLSGEKKICYSSDGQFSAFNTGLRDNSKNYIYACFVHNDKSGASEWRYEGLCTAGEGALGERLAAEFKPLPPLAKYPKGVAFNRSARLNIYNPDHILENIDRLPLDFIDHHCVGNKEARGLVDEIRFSRNYTRNSLYEKLKSVIKKDKAAKERITKGVTSAIKLAVNRARRDERLAVQYYCETHEQMMYLLPLCLSDGNSADAAIVINPRCKGRLIFKTILTLKMAYEDLRLTCDENDGWLSCQSVIKP